MSFTYEYPRPAVTADCVIFARCPQTNTLSILLIRRAREPYKDAWALPGGFVDDNEDLYVAACRELQEETGLTVPHLHQFHTFGAPGRDPRGHTITVAYVTVLDSIQEVTAGDDAGEARWHPLDSLPKLAFDHDEIIALAHRYVPLPDAPAS